MPGGPIDWTRPGELTCFAGDVTPAVDALPNDPLALCAVAQGLILLPNLATDMALSADRLDERNIRHSTAIVRRIQALGGDDLAADRPLEDRVVGTCRHFAVLACALLRHHGHTARARCGFASYFVPDRYVDHWITELLDEGRWRRVDSEILGFDYVDHPDDLADGEFLTGGEAWRLVRHGDADPASFGVDGHPDNWGIGEVRGNLVRDLASLNKFEMLPWDEWSRMEVSYRNEAGPAFDSLMDQIADACATDDEAALARMYETEDLTVPDVLLATETA